MRRTSLISSRRTRALRERPATDTRLLPLPFPTRRWKVHRPLPARPPTGGLSQPMLRPASGAPRHPRGPLCPRPRRKTCGKPMAPRTNSPVAPLGTPLSHGDGMEDTPDPLRTVESVWGPYPFPDSPDLPLGDSCSLRDGRESALPSLRMVERFPHTDRLQRETPSSPVDMRVWRGLASQPLRPGHGPSIAYTSPSVIPAESRACPCEGRGTHPSETTTCDLATPLDSFPSFRPSNRLQVRLWRESIPEDGGEGSLPAPSATRNPQKSL